MSDDPSSLCSAESKSQLERCSLVAPIPTRPPHPPGWVIHYVFKSAGGTKRIYHARNQKGDNLFFGTVSEAVDLIRSLCPQHIVDLSPDILAQFEREQLQKIATAIHHSPPTRRI